MNFIFHKYNEKLNIHYGTIKVYVHIEFLYLVVFE